MDLRQRIIKSIKKNPNRTVQQVSNCYVGASNDMIRNILDEEKLVLTPELSNVEAAPRAEYEESELIEELRRQITEKDKEKEEYRRSHGSIVATVDALKPFISKIPPPEIKYKKTRTKVKSPISLYFHVTDWHLGEYQGGEEIEYFNAYSPEIAEERLLRKVAPAVLEWVELMRHGYQIEEVVFACHGDLISGDIHPEIRRTNVWPLPKQAVESGKLLARLVAMFAPHFPIVRIEFICDDNHSRLTKKPQAKEAGYNCMNYVVGEYAKESLSRFSNVDFRIHPMSEKVINVRGRLYLMSHGHEVRGWSGSPWYGWSRKTGRESEARLQLILRDIKRAGEIGFNRMSFGHFHTEIWTPMYIGGPSLKGTDAFDHKCGRFGEPGVLAFFVHYKRGEFNRTNFSV